MFWIIHEMQRKFWSDPEVYSEDRVSALVAHFQAEFPNEDSDFYRNAAFLSHPATVAFLSPLLEHKYGTVAAAKEDVLRWLNDAGSFETYARRTRNGCGNSGGGRARSIRIPDWYARYIKTSRFTDMKAQAESSWQRIQLSGPHCIFTARHPYEAMHHNDYGRLGCGDEFRTLVPICHECHSHFRAKGPAVPHNMPEEVRQWICAVA